VTVRGGYLLTVTFTVFDIKNEFVLDRAPVQLEVTVPRGLSSEPQARVSGAALDEAETPGGLRSFEHTIVLLCLVAAPDTKGVRVGRSNLVTTRYVNRDLKHFAGRMGKQDGTAAAWRLSEREPRPRRKDLS
jgi:hypothetical protein